MYVGLKFLFFFFTKCRNMRFLVLADWYHITEGALTLNPSEVSAKFLLSMFHTGGNFVSEVGT